MTRYWKVLHSDTLAPTHRLSFRWPANGKWTPRIYGPLTLCERGYHVVRTADLLSWWSDGLGVWEVEVDPEGMVVGHDKVAVCRARLMRRAPFGPRQAREFACDCAERALSLYEREHPGDGRVRDCIAVTRRYTVGLATDAELVAAGNACGAIARAASKATSSDAAWAAAGAASRATAGVAARDAAGVAARATAWDPFGAPARTTAMRAERAWQCARLEQYLDGAAYKGAA